LFCFAFNAATGKSVFTPLATLPIAEQAKVGTVKKLLAAHLDAKNKAAPDATADPASDNAATPSSPPSSTSATTNPSPSCPPLQDPRRLRLRDKKVAAVGSILKDASSLRRALVNLSDGRQIAVQFLETPEVVRILNFTRSSFLSFRVFYK
jgi:hypothetical protein